MNPRERLLLTAGVVVGLGAYALLALRPALAERSALKVGADDLQRRYEALQRVGDELAAVLDEEQMLRARTGYVPGRSVELHVAQVVSQVDSACRQADVFLERPPVPLRQVEEDDYVKLPFSASMQGSTESLVALLQNLRRARPALAVERLAIERGGGEEMRVLKIRMTLVSFMPKEEI